MTAFSHLFVHVRDLGCTRDFYVGLLGLEVLMEHPGYLRLGGGGGFHLGLEERPDELVGADGIEIVLAVEDVRAEHARLTGLGVEFDTEPLAQEWGAVHAWLRDPDGYRLSLFSPL